MKIEIKELTKVLSGNKVVDNVNITMESGKVYGLCGYNGCGKTMLMRLIAGLIIPTTGSVSYDGKILGKHIGFPPSIGILIENPAFLNSRSGFNNLKLLASIKGKTDEKTIADAIRKVGLDPGGVKLTQKLIRQECERGALVIMTCHDKDILENVCDVIYNIEHGRIIDERNIQL